MANSALLVIDMQNDFCLPDSVLRVEGALNCLPMVVEAVSKARASGVPVVWIVREHDVQGLDADLCRRHLYKAGNGPCVAGTKGAELVTGLDVRPEDLHVKKCRFSGFFGTKLDLLLRRFRVTDIAIAGVQTPNCIRATAFDAVSLDYKVTVLRDATGARTQEVHEANLYDMGQVGINVSKVSEWDPTGLSSQAS